MNVPDLVPSNETLVRRLVEVRRELRHVNDQINDAYWRFTRQARGIPPVLAVPEAYKRRAALETEERDLKRALA